jgi:hypothetical protein
MAAMRQRVPLQVFARLLMLVPFLGALFGVWLGWSVFPQSVLRGTQPFQAFPAPEFFIYGIPAALALVLLMLLGASLALAVWVAVAARWLPARARGRLCRLCFPRGSLGRRWALAVLFRLSAQSHA